MTTNRCECVCGAVRSADGGGYRWAIFKPDEFRGPNHAVGLAHHVYVLRLDEQTRLESNGELRHGRTSYYGGMTSDLRNRMEEHRHGDR